MNEEIYCYNESYCDNKSYYCNKCKKEVEEVMINCGKYIRCLECAEYVKEIREK